MNQAVPRQLFRPKRTLFFRRILANYELYLFILPAVIYLLLYCYYPMYGAQIAFRDFKVGQGIWGSPWVGLKHLKRFLGTFAYRQLIWNTLKISLFSLALTFPIPILFSLVLNELRDGRYKKIVQTISYAPHFISTVVIVSILTMFLDEKAGVINRLIALAGGTPRAFMADASAFRSIYVLSGVWQGTGWSAIIYISALSGVDPALHESAMIDGATRLQRVIHINLPSILPTITIMLILAAGNLMSVGFEKVFLMQNPLNTEVSEIISTFVYKMGLIYGQYSFSTAIGLFNSVVNCVLLILVNTISKKIGEYGLW